MKEGVQDFIKTVGEEGCYALTLFQVGELYRDDGDLKSPGSAVMYIERAVEVGYIKADMTVLDGAAFLKSITYGAEWTKEYKPADYKPVEGDYLIAEWFNPRTKLTHFTLEYPQKWDGLKASVTKKEGAVRSYRLYRVKE